MWFKYYAFSLLAVDEHDYQKSNFTPTPSVGCSVTHCGEHNFQHNANVPAPGDVF